jgi:ferric-dicitrate binding protein FerR (iron transport regulator)
MPHATRLDGVQSIGEQSRSVAVRVALWHVRLADGSSPEAIEAALQGVLEVDPNNAQARHNLRVLLRNTGRWVEGVVDGSGS